MMKKLELEEYVEGGIDEHDATLKNVFIRQAE